MSPALVFVASVVGYLFVGVALTVLLIWYTDQDGDMAVMMVLFWPIFVPIVAAEALGLHLTRLKEKRQARLEEARPERARAEREVERLLREGEG